MQRKGEKQERGKEKSTANPSTSTKGKEKKENRLLGIVGRAAVVALGLYGWFWSQSLIQSQGPIPAGQPLRDSLLDALTPITSFLNDNPVYANCLFLTCRCQQ